MYRILIVEDDAVLRQGLKYALKKEGYMTEAAGRLEELKVNVQNKGGCDSFGCDTSGWRQ